MSVLKTWHLLVLTLPTENATARMRFWRALKAMGCAVLRDGVYLLPQSETGGQALQDLAHREARFLQCDRCHDAGPSEGSRDASYHIREKTDSRIR